MFADLSSIIAPVLFGESVGYAWAMFGRPVDTAFATSLVFYIRTPLLIFGTLTEFKYMLALRYDNDFPEVASLIITSTLMSFITLPGLLLFVL